MEGAAGGPVRRTGRGVELKADLAKAVRLARRSRDEWTLLLALSFTMQALPLTGDEVGASAAAAEGLPLAEATGDRRWVARFCARAGIVAARAGRVDDALEPGSARPRQCRGR